MRIEEKVKICPECRKEHSCYSQGCWCADFPPILPLVSKEDCLCSSCLKDLIQDEIHKYMKHLTPKKIKDVQALGKPKNYVEGIDYSINPQGNWVFTSWYLLRQGGCCTNGCINCPYPKS